MSRIPVWGLAVALSLTLVGAVLAALWPTAAVVLGAVALILALSVRAPAYAFLGALVIYSFEGSIKMRLSVEEAPSPLGFGAALIDFAFLASLAALVVQDRGRSFVRVWKRTSRWERVTIVSFVAWLCLSVIHIPVGGDLIDGLEGFRLTQLYVPALLGGIVVASRPEGRHLAPLLLGAVVLATAYAAVRGVLGPSFNEQTFAGTRTYHTEFGDLGRNVGSFTSPVSLVSFLVPAAVMCLVLGFLVPAYRWTAWALFALAMTGIVGSYVRTALVAVVAGAVLLAGLVIVGHESGRRGKAYAVGLVLLVLGGGYAATVLAGDATPQAAERAESLANPFSDESLEIRMETWEHALEDVADEPLGAGLGTVGRASLQGRRAATTDNSYIKVLVEQGVAGAILFLLGLFGILAAVTIRLRRLGIAHRPLGTAALAGFFGFIVLMLMGEYVEQPGKLLAWTLLGVAMWEAVGRPDVDPRSTRPQPRRPVLRPRELRAGISRVPVVAFAMIPACALGAGTLSVAMAASRQDDYESKFTVVVREADIPKPERAAFVASLFVQSALKSEAFHRRVANGLVFLPASKVEGLLHLSGRPATDRWELALTATGRTPREARALAQASSSPLSDLPRIQALVAAELQRRPLRERLRTGDLSSRERAAVRRTLRSLAEPPTARAVRTTAATTPPQSDRVIDRLAAAIAGRASAVPNAAWAGLAGLLCGFAGAVCLLLLLRRSPDGARS